jgi:hypothetical protein
VKRILFSFSSLLFLAPLFAIAQSSTSLQGRVVDSSGAVIPHAHVTVRLISTGATRADDTNNSGDFQFQQLMPGEYSIRVEAPGFAPSIRERVALQVSTPASLNITMSIAAEVQTTEVVSSEAVLLNTVDATLGNTFDSRQVSTLPIEGRNVVELLSLQPGVTFIGRTSSGIAGNSDSDSRAGAVNGSRSDQSNVTLDGIDVNDENSGYAFTSVLRMTQDSVAEFRVTTSNPNADASRGAGAQVALVTKSGTNQIHGAVYEYNRNVAFVANDYFNKQTELASGEPNRPGKLIRNVFGGAIGGPIWKNRIFYFANYESERRDESQVVERTVPTASYRQGTLQYPTADGGNYSLTPDQIRKMDPLGIGVSPAMLQVLQSYPVANDPTAGDGGINTAGYRFNQPLNNTFNTYIARLDWNLSQKHTLFWRGNLVNDDQPGAPQFPGQPSASSTLSNNKGFGAGYTYVISPTLVNNFRWGFTRQGGSVTGISLQPQVSLEGLDSPVAFSRGNNDHIPVNNFIDNVSWTKKNHNLSFGTDIRHIDDWRDSTSSSFPDAAINIGWLQDSAIAANPGAVLNPQTSGYPAVASNFYGNYDGSIMNLVGVVDEVDAIYNFDKTGKSIALGVPLVREYKWNEYDFYAQDSWKALPSLTLTFGLHYSYQQVPTESHGDQVGACVPSGPTCKPYSLRGYYDSSYAQGASGGSASNVPNLSFDLNGRSNHRSDFWKPDTKDFGPRFAFAWSPPAGKTSIRGGYSLVFDHFGAGVVNTFDTNGAYGLSSHVSNPAGSQTVSSSPRFQGISSIPTSLLPPAPAGGFPATPDPSAFDISWSLDSTLKTPYEHVMDLSVQRELGHNSTLEVVYVGRLAHRLLEQEDVAMPLDLTAAGTDYFTAASAFAAKARAGVSASEVQKVPYWEALFGPLTGQSGFCDPTVVPNPTATQNVYCIYQQNAGNETNALYELDLPGNGTGAGDTYPAYRFYHDQYSALYAWRSIGQSSYHALEVSLRQHFGEGVEADFNYTYSHSIDWTSQAERLNTSGGNNGAQIINSWKPDQLRGTSDFDMTHQLNANWIWDLPVGRKRRFLANSNRTVDAFLGGWQLTGILRWTSGLPYAVDDGSRWPTNWDIEGFATLPKHIPGSALRRGKGQQRYADPTLVYNYFRMAYPGESGTRNPLRGDGAYDWDAGLNKTFQLYDRAHLQIRWETFNLTNSVRFDPQSISSSIDSGGSFGYAFTALNQPRVMQVAARIEF